MTALRKFRVLRRAPLGRLLKMGEVGEGIQRIPHPEQATEGSASKDAGHVCGVPEPDTRETSRAMTLGQSSGVRGRALNLTRPRDRL